MEITGRVPTIAVVETASKTVPPLETLLDPHFYAFHGVTAFYDNAKRESIRRIRHLAQIKLSCVGCLISGANNWP